MTHKQKCKRQLIKKIVRQIKHNTPKKQVGAINSRHKGALMNITATIGTGTETLLLESIEQAEALIAILSKAKIINSTYNGIEAVEHISDKSPAIQIKISNATPNRVNKDDFKALDKKRWTEYEKRNDLITTETA